MNKNGQSIVEFSLIAILVILGVVYMGPYVLRSVNAHYKLWDDSVQDSFSEVLTNAPPNAIPPITITCSCQPDTSSGCGSANVSLSQCPANELNMNTNCNPSGCDGRPLSYCSAPVDSCCTTYYAGSCGSVQIPLVGSVPTLPTTPCPPTGVTLPPTTTLPSGATCPGIASGPSPNCYYGQRMWSTQCSDLPVVCVNDTTCDAICSGSLIFPSSATLCPNDTLNPATFDGTAIDQTYPLSFVNEATQGDCTTTKYSCTTSADCVQGATCSGGYCTCTYCNAPCQYYCIPPYTIDPASQTCEILFKVAPSSGAARPPSQYYSAGCTHAGPTPGCDNDSACLQDVYNCDFQVCGDTNTTVTTAYIIGEIGNHCGNTSDFTPGAKCSISMGF